MHLKRRATCSFMKEDNESSQTTMLLPSQWPQTYDSTLKTNRVLRPYGAHFATSSPKCHTLSKFRSIKFAYCRLRMRRRQVLRKVRHFLGKPVRMWVWRQICDWIETSGKQRYVNFKTMLGLLWSGTQRNRATSLVTSFMTFYVGRRKFALSRSLPFQAISFSS